MTRIEASSITPEDLHAVQEKFRGFNLAEKLEAWGKFALRDPDSAALLIGKSQLPHDVSFVGYED